MHCDEMVCVAVSLWLRVGGADGVAARYVGVGLKGSESVTRRMVVVPGPRRVAVAAPGRVPVPGTVAVGDAVAVPVRRPERLWVSPTRRDGDWLGVPLSVPSAIGLAVRVAEGEADTRKVWVRGTQVGVAQGSDDALHETEREAAASRERLYVAACAGVRVAVVVHGGHREAVEEGWGVRVRDWTGLAVETVAVGEQDNAAEGVGFGDRVTDRVQGLWALMDLHTKRLRR